MFSHAYLYTAIDILADYIGEEPFASYLKKFFSANKKFGSRDRKQIAHLCYCYFRLGKWSSEVVTEEEKIKAALFLCSQQKTLLTQKLLPECNELITSGIKEKIDYAEKRFGFKLQQVFPWKDDLSEEIKYDECIQSFFVQPDVFLRVRPGKEKIIEKKLIEAGISFNVISNNCIALPNASKADAVLEIDKEVVIQDINSQKTLGLFLNELPDKDKKIEAWDCCAASGGKSLLLFDCLKNVELTVSDVRENILFNLQKRFTNAGIKNYRSFVADVSAENFSTKKKFDVVICDAPCSGSGTWSRKPEQLYFFEKEKINYYSELQKKIALNAAKAVKENGFFIYITCSAFKKENEEVVAFLQKNSSLLLKSVQYLKGYNKKADTLFTALFTL